jgi:hypothetical protein
MTTAEAALIVFAVVSSSLAGTYFALARARRKPSERARIIAAAHARTGLTVWDTTTHRWVHLPPGVQPGPGQMTNRDIEEADQLELLWLSPAYDAGRERLKKRINSEPHVAAAFDRIADDGELAPDLADFANRLRKEIRDEQQKGDQT